MPAGLTPRRQAESVHLRRPSARDSFINETIPSQQLRRGSHTVTTATGSRVAIRPLEDRIVVQAVEAETTTASGLVIPDTAKEKPQEGIVLAIGPGRFEDGQRIPLDVKEGDRVLYSKYGGTEVKYNGEEYLILSARDVLAVVN